MRPYAFLVTLLLVPSALAGTPEAPEVTDAAGDCAFAPGNHYADIIAAWISDETATDLIVNIRLSEWIADATASFAGYTIQFTHQGVQWGVAGLYQPDAGWEWTTASIDVETGEMGGFNDTTGEFDAATATMRILFPKSLFPHEGDDDKLRGFSGGTADFKKDVPGFIVGDVTGTSVAAGDMMVCDVVQSDATYTFQVGGHSMHAASATASATEDTSDETDAVPVAAQETAADPAENDTAFPGVFALVATAFAVAWLTARRRL